MKKPLAAAIMTLAVLAAFSGEKAAAQFYPSYNRSTTNPYQRPPISPYFGLLGPGTTAQRYFTLVQPQQQNVADQFRLGQQITANQQGILGLQTADLASTGHPTRFLNYQRYFNNLNATVSGVSGMAATANFGARLGQGVQGLQGAGMSGAGMARPPTRPR